MKFAVAFVALVAVALAGVVKPIDNQAAELEAIIAAINSPSTDPATAILLEQQLQEILDSLIVPEPIHSGPALVDFPAGDGGALSPIETAPVVVPPASAAPASSSSLVQIIVNVNAESGAVAGSPVVSAPALTPESVSVVENAPESVSVVDNAPESVSVVETAPEAVIVAQPPPAVVVLPDVLN